MNTYNDYSVWRLDRDYCSDESGRSAEYKLGVQHHRLLEEAEEKRETESKDNPQRQMPRPHMMNRTLYLIPNNRNTKFGKNINRSREA